MKLGHVLACGALLTATLGTDDAAAAGPAVQSACYGTGVESTLGSAHTLASAAAGRLNGLAALSSSQRASAWSSGPERRWFGDYSNLRFNNVRNRMNDIASALNDWRLDVHCRWDKSYFGNASPGIRRITLGSAWKTASSGNADKPQTFVHEAAHIRGATLGGEARGKYGVADALKRAQKYPGVAVRTAENLGYYAVCRSPSWTGKGGCP